MGLLDSIVAGALKGMTSPSDTQDVPGALSQILGKTDLGNIGGLLVQLQRGGLDRQVASWLGNGANMPISPDQLRSALGDSNLQQMGRSAGLPVDQLMKVMAQFLPGTVDRMSPNGALEEAEPQDEGNSGSLADQAGLNDIKP